MFDIELDMCVCVFMCLPWSCAPFLFLSLAATTTTAVERAPKSRKSQTAVNKIKV